MGKALIIAEKPSVAKDIANSLGGFSRTSAGYYESATAIVASAVGHLVGLHVPAADNAPKGIDGLPIIPDRFDLTVDAESSKPFSTLKKLMASPEVASVINACDAGREGELIFRYIYLKAGCRKPMQRMWLQSMTPASIRSAYADLRPGHEFDALFHAAQCRSEADWLVGINGSRAVKALRQLQTGAYEGVSVGRVQTPTLSMVVHRELDIRNFKPQDYWEVQAVFACAAGQYAGRWFNPSRSDGEHRHRIDSVNEARAISARCHGVSPTSVVDDVTAVCVTAPKLFDLTTLQREANKRFGFSAKKTLDLAQSLYDSQHGVLTYPRTNSNALPDDYPETVKQILEAFCVSKMAKFAREILDGGWVNPSNKRIFDGSKISDHFAIIPTGVMPSGLTGDEAKIYELVVRRFIAAFYPDAEYRQTVRLTTVATDIFRSSGRTIVSEGWKAVHDESPDDVAAEKDPVLCVVAVGEAVRTERVVVQAMQTKPPRRFTEDTLLGAMEGAGKVLEDEAQREAMKAGGLGTPATRAGIIERLLSPSAGFMVRERKELVPQETGMALILFLEANDLAVLTSPVITGEWEQKLAVMESGAYQRAAFMEEVGGLTRRIVETIRIKMDSVQAPELKVMSGVQCPCCGGVVASKKDSLDCQSCRYRLWREIAGVQLSDLELVALLRDGCLPVRDGFVSRAKKRFSAGLKLVAEGKVEFVFEERPDGGNGGSVAPSRPSGVTTPAMGAKCPKCQGDVRDRGQLYACDGGDFKLWKKVAGRTLTDKEVVRLITDKRLPKMDGFVSSKGKSFSAALRLSGDFSKVEFVFDA